MSLPPVALFQQALRVATPAVVYDYPGITATVRRMQDDIAPIPGAQLNFAVKACHTPDVLAHLAGLGLGGDTASVGELELATSAGFQEITATGPAFSAADFTLFRAVGVTVDLDSVAQIEAYGRAHPGTDAGLRVRIPLPEKLEMHSTFGRNSRFGVNATDHRVHEAFARHGLRLTRLHLHTGQTSPEKLLYKVAYTLHMAAKFPHLHTIDVGGGFFHLYLHRGRARAALRRTARMVEEWQTEHGRPIALRFEPGGGVLAPHGYLFTEVRSVEEHHEYYGTRVVTVDSSAWNLAPWHKPTVLAADPAAGSGPPRPGLIAGNTLYENDFFGTDIHGKVDRGMTFPPCRPGDRLVITASGAYTLTNSRRFNRIPAPAEYAFDGTGSLRELPGAPFA
ncbi:diaminopimelate decarboxylase family protein [Streptomyces sp. NPDC058045]|uniref:diaminopimelate decarboxylase family protein n=1 Tax=Streptomyces sp. NPDC058045 TaxID=3346311 RepID=UPI0036E9556F